MEEPFEEEVEDVGACRRVFLFIVCYWRSLLVITAPIILIPITVIADGRFGMCMYVIFLMSLWWLTEALPLAITSLLPFIVFPVMGIMSMTQLCNSFVTNSSMSFLSTFIIGQAFEYCLLDQRIALMILKYVSCKPKVLHILLITTTFMISMWIMNVAVVAIMCPIVKAILRELETHGLCKQFAENLSSDGEPTPSKTALAFYVGVSFSAIFGGCSTLIGTGANRVMVETYRDIFEKEISFLAFFVYAFPIMFLLLIVSTIYLQWRFLGLFSTGTSDDCSGTEEALEMTKQSVMREYDLLEPFFFHEQLVLTLCFIMVVLLMTRRPEVYMGWDQALFDGHVTEATVSTFILILLHACPSHLSFWNYFSKKDAYLPNRRSRGAISWNFVRVKVPWRILFLIGGGMSLAEASHKIQMATHIANFVTTLDHFPHLVLSLLFYLPVFVLTQCIGNAPLAHMILPIIVDLAVCHQIHPTYFMIPATIICSLALTTPAGTGANALIVGFANIRAVDIAQIGLVPAIVSFLLVWLSFNAYGPLLFPEIDQRSYAKNLTDCEQHLIDHLIEH